MAAALLLMLRQSCGEARFYVYITKISKIDMNMTKISIYECIAKVSIYEYVEIRTIGCYIAEQLGGAAWS